MKTVIYCFTGTGNNLMIARRLADLLGETDVLPIHTLKLQKQIPSQYDWVGFVTPAYYSHVPPLVKEAMADIKFNAHQKIFTIVGCGINRGAAHEDLRGLVKQAGKEVKLEYMFMMPGSYILSYNGFPDWVTKLTTQIAERKIKKVANDLKADRTKALKKYGIFYKVEKETALQEKIAGYLEICKNYTVSDTCIQCKTCIAVCPSQNIRLEDGKIAFGNDCQQCMACIQWCPQKAIDYKGLAATRKHYHHPAITVKMMKNFQQDH